MRFTFYTHILGQHPNSLEYLWTSPLSKGCSIVLYNGCNIKTKSPLVVNESHIPSLYELSDIHIMNICSLLCALHSHLTSYHISHILFILSLHDGKSKKSSSEGIQCTVHTRENREYLNLRVYHIPFTLHQLSNTFASSTSHGLSTASLFGASWP